MARNILLAIFRGIKSSMPSLGQGELAIATDEIQLYMGTVGGNVLPLLNTTAKPTGSGGGMSAPMHKAGDPGPAVPQKVVAYAKLVIGNTTYWVPLCQ